MNMGRPNAASFTPRYVVPTALPNGLQIVPIGKPIDNGRAYVLDNYLHPVPPGAKGEFFIGGVGVGTRLLEPAGPDR